MAKKMYYTEEEAAAKLNVTVVELTGFAREGKLQQYQDGARRVYRADQVDAFAATLAASAAVEDTAEIELAPADTGTVDAVSFSEIDEVKEPGKEDTVITAEGISIFDDQDLDIEAADPMAKTQIAPSLEDQISLEGSGSGSGLLDLTRESDDTSLGAEVLDHIDMDSGITTGLAAETPGETYAAAQEAAAAEAPLIVEEMDAGAGLFSGLLVGGALMAVMLAIVMVSAMAEQSFGLIEAMKNQMPLVTVAIVIVLAVCGVVGMLLGKSMGQRQTAMREASN